MAPPNAFTTAHPVLLGDTIMSTTSDASTPDRHVTRTEYHNHGRIVLTHTDVVGGTEPWAGAIARLVAHHHASINQAQADHADHQGIVVTPYEARPRRSTDTVTATQRITSDLAGHLDHGTWRLQTEYVVNGEHAVTHTLTLAGVTALVTEVAGALEEAHLAQSDAEQAAA